MIKGEVKHVKRGGRHATRFESIHQMNSLVHVMEMMKVSKVVMAANEEPVPRIIDMSVRTAMNMIKMRHPDHQQQSDIYICNES